MDLHEALKVLALGEKGDGKPAVVHLKKEVASYDAEAGSVTFTDGSVASGDLVVAADGVHSKAVETVVGYHNPALPTQKYNFCYRFLIPTAEIAADPETAIWTKDDDGKLKLIITEGRRLVWYPCRKYVLSNSKPISFDLTADYDKQRATQFRGYLQHR